MPMEFCVLVEGQRYHKDGLSKGAEKKLRNMSLVSPMERKQRICDTVNSVNDGPCGGEIARQFGITVSKEMAQVTGRVLSLQL
ncbi:hypothetical protein MRB53_020936 [Persea americana]|uniref:Uncharacterized protein n=1 Tax=Persea americana TaxID=3435 RepID=A0ACC2L3L4_PERAE|nr:hypothetical protein MRB53_020936 [Persea americana]